MPQAVRHAVESRGVRRAIAVRHLLRPRPLLFSLNQAVPPCSPAPLPAPHQGPQSYSVNRHSHCHSSNSSSLHGRRFPADWKLLYNAHHFTDFLAWPLMAPSAQRANAGSAAAGVNLDSLCSGNVLYNSGHTVGPGSALAAACASQEGGSFVVGAITLYLSRPGADLVGDAPPSVFSNTLEQELVGLALSGVLFSGGFEPVRQICELVMALQTSTGTGELAAAVAACLQARLRHVLSVQPTALLALVPPRQVSALVFRDLSAAPTDAAGGDMTSTVGQSSSQTLPLLHPALASATGAGTGGGANSNLYSGSHSHGGGAARVALRNAAVAAAGLDGSSPAHTIERSPSLLGTGLRHAAGAGGDTNGAGASASGQVGGTGASVGEGIVVGGGGTGPGGGSRLHMQNSRSMGVLQQNNPSGLFSCRLDRMPSRYKALVFPLSHTLLQQVLLQRQDRGKGSKGGSQEADPKRPGAVGLRDMCMSAAAAAAAAGGASSGGWIIADCNEHLHAVHSPSRDVYVMTRVNGRRPHSLVLATAELGGGLEPVGGVGGMSAAAAGAAGSACIAVYLAFPERLPQALLESALNDTMLIMRKVGRDDPLVPVPILGVIRMEARLHADAPPLAYCCHPFCINFYHRVLTRLPVCSQNCLSARPAAGVAPGAPPLRRQPGRGVVGAGRWRQQPAQPGRPGAAHRRRLGVRLADAPGAAGPAVNAAVRGQHQ